MVKSDKDIRNMSNEIKSRSAGKEKNSKKLRKANSKIQVLDSI